MIETTVGSYRITEQVSVGGMGTVYRAEHVLIGKAAAVKVLHTELRNNAEVVQRFFNEAKTLSVIKHPGIVEIFDFGYTAAGDGYLVMEFLDGAPLARVLEGPMDEVRAATLLRGVCNALSLAHGKGIVHRDLKPDNIFVCPDADLPSGERTKLLDFGIAKVTVASNADRSATKAGIVMGTPTYMSPEQCKGAGTVDHRADLYSLGCILYEALCGVPPFEADGAGELIAMHLFMEPKPPRECNASISPEAERLILDLLAKDPAKRPTSAAEVSQRLASLARGAGWIATPATGIPIAAVTGPYETQPPPEPTTLSGAASQSILEHPRRHRVLWLGAIGVVVAVVAVIVLVSSSHSNGVTHAAATPILPAPAPTPEPPKPVAVEPKPATLTPPAPVESTTPPLAAPEAPHLATVKVKKPITKPAPPHHTVKPASPPPDAGSAAPKILIEKDL